MREVAFAKEGIRILYRSDNGAVVHVDGDDTLTRALADRDGVVWVDLTISTDEDSAILRDVFHFHELTIEDCVSERVDPARIDDYGDYLFLIIQALANYNPEAELEPVEVDFYLGVNYVVSCHREPIAAIEQFRERCLRDERKLRGTSDWVLHGLVDAIIDEYLPIVDAVDDTIDRLEEEVLHRPDTALMRRILIAKRNALRIRRAAVPQRDVMNRLARGEFPKLIHEPTMVYFRDIYDHLVRIDYLVDALRDLADSALNMYLSVVSNRLNEIMKVLTAVGAVFLPGALIAGIYGTNFPEKDVWPPYDSEWGFWVVVGVIIACTLAILAYMRYRRWI
jgi:magnesium transporter